MIKPAAIVVLCGCVLACGDHVDSFLRGHESTEVVEISGDVVSRINGSAIGLNEVERLAHVGDLAPNAALERLQSERLLGQEARARGYARRSQTQLLAREAVVQELLTQVVEPVEVEHSELEAAYQAQKARFVWSEKRRGTHVLAQLAPTAGPAAERSAETFIQQTIRALQATSDMPATLAEIQSQSSDDFKVAVQELPLSADDGTFVPEFSRAFFSIAAPGVVPQAVHTQFGYHAIVVSEIVPAQTENKSVAFETLEQEISTRKRTQRLDELLRDLRARTPVKFAPDAHKILASVEL